MTDLINKFFTLVVPGIAALLIAGLFVAILFSTIFYPETKQKKETAATSVKNPLKKAYDCSLAKGRVYNHCAECISGSKLLSNPVLAYEKQYYLNLREKYFTKAEQLRIAIENNTEEK